MFHPLKCLRRVRSMAVAFGVLLANAAAASVGSDTNGGKATVIVVVGAGGEVEYGRQFTDWAGRWEIVCQQAGAKRITIGLETADPESDRDRLQAALSAEPKDGPEELWLVLLGHGTFDGRDAKFNLRGPDVSAAQLAEWLASFQRPLAVINASSASGPFLNALAKPGRVIVTAAKSGSEINFARFGGHFSEAIASLESDLDKDGQVSLLEAWLSASHRVTEFYKADGRLATEHSLLEDNGDGLGTPADWFRGVRAVKQAAEGASVDGRRAHQFHLVRSELEKQLPPEVRAKRDELELAIFQLRDDKATLPEDEYYTRLERLLVDLARLYEASSKSERLK
jgi:hypothetical protein